MSAQQIVRYGLYGEAFSTEDPEFIHIEGIQSRSVLHNWEIRPHTHHRMFQIVLLLGGGAELMLDNQQRHIDGPCSVTIPSGVVHGFVMSPQTHGYVITISELLLLDARYRRSRKIFEPLYREPYVIDCAADAQALGLLQVTVEQMEQEFLHPRMGRDAMFEWLLRILLMQIRRSMESQLPATQADAPRQDMYVRFTDLLEQHFRRHWTVEAYAKSLAISQVHLNRLCRAVVERSANELIQDRLILEAQRHLIYSSASVSMIAYDLGYKDPAYFSRVFKRRTGVAPGQFRRQRGQDT